MSSTPISRRCAHRARVLLLLASVGVALLTVFISVPPPARAARACPADLCDAPRASFRGPQLPFLPPPPTPGPRTVSRTRDRDAQPPIVGETVPPAGLVIIALVIVCGIWMLLGPVRGGSQR